MQVRKVFIHILCHCSVKFQINEDIKLPHPNIPSVGRGGGREEVGLNIETSSVTYHSLPCFQLL